MHFPFNYMVLKFLLFLIIAVIFFGSRNILIIIIIILLIFLLYTEFLTSLFNCLINDNYNLIISLACFSEIFHFLIVMNFYQLNAEY